MYIYIYIYILIDKTTNVINMNINDSKGSEHEIVAAVLSYCDGTYLEDQDQWWLIAIV